MNYDFFRQDIEEVFRFFDSSPEGISRKEVGRRLIESGLNTIESETQINRWQALLHQFTDPLIYILLVAALFTAVIGHYIDMWVILAVVLLNAVIGFTQELKAEQAIRSLFALAAPLSHVLRGGERLEIESAHLVPGDIVLLSSGTRVPADLRLFEVNRLEIDESALTGESLGVSKNTLPVEEQGRLSPGELHNAAFMGTLVLAGRGKGIVVGSGRNTELGRISEQVSRVKPAPTPLQVQLARFGRWLGYGILAVSAASIIIGLLLGRNLYDMLLTGVALAVGAIPEGLPVVVTITLSIGVKKMARRNAVIRRLPAVETLGSTTVIASDKTGTMTKNEMTVQKIWVGEQEYHLTGVGFSPDGGDIFKKGVSRKINFEQENENEKALKMCLRAGLLANESRLGFDEKRGYYPDGDPTEVALIVAAKKAGLNPEEQALLYPTMDIIPFESDLMFMASLHKNPLDEGNIIFLKGAPERVLGMCSSMLGGPEGEETPVADFKEDILQRSKDMAAEGLRVLAVAYRKEAATVTALQLDELRDGFVFAGLHGMMDPPRMEVFTAIARAKKAGIRVMMVTGDNETTAVAIARKLKVVKEDDVSVITGRQLEEMSDEELFDRVRTVNIFARVTPLHKLRIVQQLIKNREVVAVTGDGVNDTPALKAAHIGVSMGKGGTDAAKETSDMIITDDNFASIFSAVEEGRIVFNNIRKVILFLLSTGLAQIILIVFSLLMGIPLPLLPTQILWLNLATNGLQDVALAFEPGEEDVTNHPPRHRDEPVLSRLMVERLMLIGIVIAAGTLYAFSWALGEGYSLRHARTVALTTIVFYQLFNVFNVRSESRSIFKMPLLSNPFLFVSVVASIIAQVFLIYLPSLQVVFRTSPLQAVDWVVIIMLAITVTAAVELEKIWRRYRLK